MTTGQTTLRIALVGTGRMGQAVETAASERGHEIVARFDKDRPLLDERDPDALNGADLAIDFSLPDVALDHIHRYCFWGVDAVVGTTGWYDDLSKVQEWVDEGQNGLLYAPNFSLGVALMQRALRAMLPLLNRLTEYDAFVHELHHTGKVDSPSGTAIALAQTLLAGLDRKTELETETQHGAIRHHALHVTSSRVGAVKGDHVVGFDSEMDQLTIQHVAKDRKAFAMGAVRAAEWLPGKRGLFTIEDWLRDLETPMATSR